jgi:hypothetical protein
MLPTVVYMYIKNDMQESQSPPAAAATRASELFTARPLLHGHTHYDMYDGHSLPGARPT